MKTLIVAPRWPWPPYSGDRARALLWIEAVRDRSSVVLVAPGNGNGNRNEAPEGVIAIRPAHSLRSLAGSLRRAASERLPWHVLIGARWDWRAALETANATHGPFDSAIVLLSRLAPLVSSHVTAKRRIFDPIDSADVGMAERANASTGIFRSFWTAERNRIAPLERETASRYDAVVTVAAEEAQRFDQRAVAIPMGVAPSPLDANGERPFDFGFWGQLAYFANSEAARQLVESIWPEIRRRRPNATLFVGGADASHSVRAYDGRDGITVVSPVLDRASALRRVRIALFPISFGSGQSMKSLEAAEAGCAIIGSPLAFRALPELADKGIVVESPEQFVENAVALFDDRDRSAQIGANLRAAVEGHYTREISLRRMAGVVFGER